MPVPVGAFLALLTTVTFIATLVASFKLAGPASRVAGTTVFNTMQHDATHYQTASNVAKVLGSAAGLAISFGPTLALAGICNWLSDHGLWTWLGQHGFWRWVMHTDFGQCLNLTFGSGHRWYARTWGVVMTLVFLFTMVGTPFILLGIAAGWLD